MRFQIAKKSAGAELGPSKSTVSTHKHVFAESIVFYSDLWRCEYLDLAPQSCNILKHTKLAQIIVFYM